MYVLCLNNSNVAYSVGLSEEAKRSFEGTLYMYLLAMTHTAPILTNILAASEFGRVQLTDERAAAMWRSKLAHFYLFVIFLIVSVLFAGTGAPGAGVTAAMLPRVAFLLGGLYECYSPDATALEMTKRMLRVLVAFGLGFAVWGILFSAAVW